MTPLHRIARDIDQVVGGRTCRDAIRDASKAGTDLWPVLWRFLADVLRAIKRAPDQVQIFVDFVIDGFDRRERGMAFPEVDRDKWDAAKLQAPFSVALAAAGRAAATWQKPLKRGLAASVAYCAALAGATRIHQWHIFLRLVREASE
jgi:hypothetical protein